MNKDLKEILKTKTRYDKWEHFLKKNNIHAEVLSFKLYSNEQIGAVAYRILNDLIETPKCKNCNTEILQYNNHYQTFCSKSCSSCFNASSNLKKRKETCLIKYGVDNPWKSEAIKNKIKKTNLERYGVEQAACSDIIKAKAKETNLERYNTVSPSQNKSVQDKIKKTNIEKYGVDNPWKSEAIKNKIKKTNIEKYGVENVFKSKQIQDKIKETTIKLYGTPHNKQRHILNRTELQQEIVISKFVKHNGRFDMHAAKQYYNCGKTYIYNNFDIPKSMNIVESELLDFVSGSIQNDRLLIKPLEIDILSHEYKFGIEYNGIMWHSFGISNSAKFNNAISEQKCKHNHLRKTELTEAKDYQLFHIFEDEYRDQRTKDIWLSIIKNKMGISSEIKANKCTIKEIGSKECSEFLELNHLQGTCNSTVRIGLFYMNKLQSVMTFLELSDSKYELIRFCSKLGINVQRGAMRLLSYFKLNYNPESIICSVNRRWNTGSLYVDLGFEFIRNTEPNYFYFKINENILYPSDQFKKHKLKVYDSGLTESENMYTNGYRKIYDCGNKVYIKRY